jgi:hypothetical protein
VACLAFVLGIFSAARAQAPAEVSGSGELHTGTGERAQLIVLRSIIPGVDGGVLGELEFHQYVRSPSTGAAIHYVTRERVVCLEVQGNVAWVGAVVTASTNPAFPPGFTQAVWYFEDNGGGADPRDRFNCVHDHASIAVLCRDAETQSAVAETASPVTRGHFEVRDGS